MRTSDKKHIEKVAGSLLAVCDGAHQKDGAGYNKTDTGFVRSVIAGAQQYGSLTDKQAVAVQKILRKYKRQIPADDYEKLCAISPSIPEKKTRQAQPQPKIKVVGTTENQYGLKALLDTNYQAKDTVKALDWETTHRSWDGSNWTIDLTTESLSELRDVAEIEVPQKYWDLADRPLLLKEDGAWIYCKNRRDFNFKPISNLLSYEVEGKEYSRKYKSGEWDGTISLFDYKQLKFPLGLLGKVTRYLDEEGVNYELDREAKPSLEAKISWTSQYSLRDYQKQAVQEVVENGSGVIDIPTGGGKTLVATKIIAEECTKTAIFVHKQELISQWKESIEKNLGYEPGVIGAGEDDRRDITIVMLQTANNRDLSDFFKDVGLAIFDETHHIAAETFYEVFQKCPAKKRVGLSATPFREDNKDIVIEAGTGGKIIEITPLDLIKEGFLVPPKFEIEKGVSAFHSSYQKVRRELVESEERNNKIASKAQELVEDGRKVYIHVQQIKHGKALEKLVDGSKFVYGKHSREERDKAIKDFKNGETDILISTLLGEGVDIPNLDALIIADGGKSEVAIVQLVGRALRPYPGKKDAVIVDYIDNARYFKTHAKKRQRYYREYYTPVFHKK